MPHGFSNQMKLLGGALETYRLEPNDLLIVRRQREFNRNFCGRGSA